MSVRIFTQMDSCPKHVASIYSPEGDDISHGSLIINYPDTGAPVGIIENIWTHEKYRRKGLATQIMTELIKIATDKKCYKVILDTADHNVQFYQKLGFVKWQNSMRLSLQ